MQAAIFLANLIGVVLIELFLLKTEGSIPEEFLQYPVANLVNFGFYLAVFIFLLTTTLIYEQPIRAYLTSNFDKASVSSATAPSGKKQIALADFAALLLRPPGGPGITYL